MSETKFSFKAKINQQPKNEKKEKQHIVILKQNYYKDYLQNPTVLWTICTNTCMHEHK